MPKLPGAPGPGFISQFGAGVRGNLLAFRRGRAACLIGGTHWGSLRVILGLYWDNGKENGNFYSILGLYRV